MNDRGLDDAHLAALVKGLRQDPEQSRQAWLSLREVLRTEPERATGRICSELVAALAAGTPLPDQASVIPAVMACTKRQPGLVPVSFLKEVLSRAGQVDALSLLCLADRLAALDPKAIMTKGLVEVIVATEWALIEPHEEAARWVHRYAKDMAVRLWHTVAAQDPATVVVVLESWIDRAGFRNGVSQLFTESLLESLPRHAELLPDTLAVLETVRVRPGQTQEDVESADRFIHALRELGERVRRKEVAARLAEKVAAAFLHAEASEGSEAPPARIPAPDPVADRLVEELLSPDPERVRAAREQLAGKVGHASPAFVWGIAEVADELFRTEPASDLFRDLVLFLSVATETRPALVPTATLQGWVGSDAVGDPILALCFAMLARACPEWTVEHMLARATSTALGTAHASSTTILVGLARARPESVLTLLFAWLEVMGWEAELGPAICASFEEIARSRPEMGQDMITFMEGLKGADPEPGWITLESNTVSECIDRLARLVGN